MSDQILTLVAVIVGALASSLATLWLDRVRWRRTLADSWRLQRLEAYRDYLRDAKALRIIAQRIAASVDLDDQAPPLPRGESLAVLAQADASRGASHEMVALTGSAETLRAAHQLNRSLWRLEWFARGLIDDEDSQGWKEAMRQYMQAIDVFIESARKDVGAPDVYSRRSPEPSPAVAYLQERQERRAP